MSQTANIQYQVVYGVGNKSGVINCRITDFDKLTNRLYRKLGLRNTFFIVWDRNDDGDYFIVAYNIYDSDEEKYVLITDGCDCYDFQCTLGENYYPDAI